MQIVYIKHSQLPSSYSQVIAFDPLKDDFFSMAGYRRHAQPDISAIISTLARYLSHNLNHNQISQRDQLLITFHNTYTTRVQNKICHHYAIKSDVCAYSLCTPDVLFLHCVVEFFHVRTPHWFPTAKAGGRATAGGGRRAVDGGRWVGSSGVRRAEASPGRLGRALSVIV